jgi:hypothetical protein
VTIHVTAHATDLRSCQAAVLDTIKKYVDLTASTVTILGIVFAISQYYQIKQDGRITATLGYVSRFDQSPIADPTSKLDASLAL